MNSSGRNGRSVSLILAAITFLFPFVTVSCEGEPAGSATGVQLAVGATVQQQQFFGPPQEERMDPEPFASLALALVMFGAIAGLFPGGPGKWLAMGGAAGAFVSLLVLRSRINTEVRTEGMGSFSVQWEFGYWLCLTACIAAAAFALRSPVTAVEAGGSEVLPTPSGWNPPPS